ncbi:MAG: sulfite exporter TauE/SafE family protein [Thermoleophilia bacterium]|nr:sulfite exporter TauE/SafE family protein [Thermoleophilia bacterium]
MDLPAELNLTAFLIALAGGAASFLTPCVLPLLPAYLSFVSGLSVEELKEGNRRVFLSTLAFVLGFAVVFTLMGAGFSFVGALIRNQRVLEIVAGAVLILLGAVIAGLATPRFMQRDVRPLLSKAPRGPAGAFILGVAFAFGWTPCVGPILGSILTLAAEGSSPVGGALLLFVYSLGMGIPFLISGLFVGWALRAFERVRHHLRVIQIVCGVLLIVYGGLLVSGKFAWLSRLSNWGLG